MSKTKLADDTSYFLLLYFACSSTRTVDRHHIPYVHIFRRTALYDKKKGKQNYHYYSFPSVLILKIKIDT